MKHPVDTSTWGWFKVSELFDCQTTKTMNPSKDGLSEGEIPYVTRSAFNNGISGSYSDPTGEFTTEGNCITIGAEGAVAFYQYTDFIAGVKVYALRHERLNPLSALFVCSVLNENARRYSYTNARVLDKIKEETIQLPLKQGTNPSDYSQEDIDWEYMEGFMSHVQDAAKERLANLPEPGQKSKTPIDVSGWGEFKLVDIAKLTNGNKFDKNKMSRDNASINFVSRTGFNNGVSDFVDEIDGIEPYPEGAITLALGGSVGSTFVQTAPFYTGQNVGVIEFENKSFLAKQFVAAVLTKTCSIQFSAFKNEINKHFKRDLTIPLPLKSSADPSNYTQDDIDWDYMESFMSRFKKLAKNCVERLTSTPDCDILTV